MSLHGHGGRFVWAFGEGTILKEDSIVTYVGPLALLQELRSELCGEPAGSNGNNCSVKSTHVPGASSSTELSNLLPSSVAFIASLHIFGSSLPVISPYKFCLSAHLG